MTSAAIRRIYVGMPRPLSHDGKTVTSGIVKRPVDGAVMLGPTHFDGDGQANLDVHGGEEKAAYAYCQSNVERWAEDLGVDAETLHFGENLRLTGLDDADVHIGERLGLGDAVVEVTQPRLPCSKLGMLFGDPDFPARFLNATRPGFYMRIVRPGAMQAGDPVERLGKPDHAITVTRLVRLVTHDRHEHAAAADALARLEWLDPGWRRRLQAVAKIRLAWKQRL